MNGKIMRRLTAVFVLVATFWCVPKVDAQARGTTLKKIAEFDLPGPGGKRFDYLTIDRDDHYLILDLDTHRAYTPEQEEDGKPAAKMVVYDTVRVH